MRTKRDEDIALHRKPGSVLDGLQDAEPLDRLGTELVERTTLATVEPARSANSA